MRRIRQITALLAGLMLVRASRGAPRAPEADIVGAGMGVLLTGGFTVLSVWALLFSEGPRAWNVSGNLPLWRRPAWVGAGPDAFARLVLDFLRE